MYVSQLALVVMNSGVLQRVGIPRFMVVDTVSSAGVRGVSDASRLSADGGGVVSPGRDSDRSAV